MRPYLVPALLLIAAGSLTAEEKSDLDYAQVLFVKAAEERSGVWSLDVTVRHADSGWDHYADAWQVVDPQTGKVLGERVLLHPHETEQPFTRSQSGISIPASLESVLVRARCNVHGFGDGTVLVDLAEGRRQDHEVTRR